MCRYHNHHGLKSSSSSSSSSSSQQREEEKDEEPQQQRDWNIMYDTVRIVRGPLLVLGAMMVLIYPFLSPWIVMIWTIGCVGIMVTAMDVVVYYQYHWNMPIVVWILEYAKSNNNWNIQQVVLDDVLKSIFSIANGGMIASIVGSIIGCFSMYNLPLTPEQRTRIIQSCLPSNTTNTNTTTSHELLFQPGGLWNFLQSLYYQQQQQQPNHPTITTNSDSLYDDKRSNETTTTTTTATAVVVQETIPNDLTWDDNDNDNDDKDDDESDHSTLEEITAASSTPPRRRLLLESTKHATTSSSSTSNANRNDPVEVFWSILTCEVGPQIKKQIMDKLIILLDQPTKKVGMISALTLMVQLKYSPFLRKLIHNVAHGSLAATLLTMTIASFTTRQLLLQLTTSTQQQPQQQQQQQQVSSSTSLLSHRHQLRQLLPRTIKGILAMAAMILVGRTTQTKHKRRQRRQQRVSR